MRILMVSQHYPPHLGGYAVICADTAALLAKNPPEWQEAERAHRVTFTDAAGRHELWYEDARSIAPKLELAASGGLAGISAWALGQEDPAIWELLAREY